jgi:Na+-driven multidrug efflux pump
VVAFIFSVIVTLGCTGVVWAYGRRRPQGEPVTWGEAMIAATFVFFVLFLAYGVVPHQWLAWADNELNWRADRILEGPGKILHTGLPFAVTYQTIRDIIAAGIYIVFFGMHIALWVLWQKRGQEKPKEIPTSPFGRPLVRKV